MANLLPDRTSAVSADSPVAPGPAWTLKVRLSATGGVLHVISSQESRDASGESGNTDNEQSNDERRPERPGHPLLNAALAQRDSPLVRAHNLSPIAPQPAHISPLASGAHAQVAALRRDLPATASSPESSSHGNKRAEKRNKQKKKRKATDVVTPYIKPEPISPEPMSAPALARPQKRQRQVQRPCRSSGMRSRGMLRPSTKAIRGPPTISASCV